MAAPMKWKNNDGKMNENSGNNAFRPPQHLQQNRFNQDFPNARHFRPNAPPFLHQNNRFNRPNFTSPTPSHHVPGGFPNKPNEQRGGQLGSTTTTDTAQGSNFGNQHRMTQGSYMANNQMSMPPQFQMGTNHHQNMGVNEGNPINMGMSFPNQPPMPNHMFNPNIPPPMQNSFIPPPSDAMRPPGFHQMNRPPPPLSHQGSAHSQPPSTFSPSNQSTSNQEFVKDVPDDVLKGGEDKKRNENQNKEDVDWVSKWTKSIGKTQERERKPTITVSKTQERTRHMIVLLARLQKGKQDLETMKNEDKSIWEQKLKEVSQIKTELEALHQELTSEETVSALKQSIEKTRKKRERIKRRKIETVEMRREELTRREEIHARMDKEIQQVIEKQRLKKQEEEMKKEADQILGQVRKKISDANKTIQLLNGIGRLRTLRKDRLTNQGILSMYESHGESSTKGLKFESNISDMVGLLNTQLDTYKAEEEALKVILETEQEETREKEREKVLQKQEEKQRREKLAENKMLFGNQKDPKPGDPLFPFWQYYTMAENSLEALVSIRREWDMYLALPNTAGSSCIPSDWVIPPEPSSDVWNTALMDGKP